MIGKRQNITYFQLPHQQKKITKPITTKSSVLSYPPSPTHEKNNSAFPNPDRCIFYWNRPKKKCVTVQPPFFHSDWVYQCEQGGAKVTIENPLSIGHQSIVTPVTSHWFQVLNHLCHHGNPKVTLETKNMLNDLKMTISR